MMLTRTDPWRLMQQWYDEANRPSHRSLLNEDDSQMVGGDWVPAVDIKEEEDRYVLHADIPGVKPEEIEVSMENGVLTIKGERKHEATEEKENFKRVERSYGVFYRRFSLPDNTAPEKVDAISKDGVLEVTIPKTEAKRAQRIEVKPHH